MSRRGDVGTGAGTLARPRNGCLLALALEMLFAVVVVAAGADADLGAPLVVMGACVACAGLIVGYGGRPDPDRLFPGQSRTAKYQAVAAVVCVAAGLIGILGGFPPAGMVFLGSAAIMAAFAWINRLPPDHGPDPLDRWR